MSKEKLQFDLQVVLVDSVEQQPYIRERKQQQLIHPKVHHRVE